MNNKILYGIITAAFVGGLFTAAYAGPILPLITLAGDTRTLGDADVDGDLNVDGTLTGVETLEGLSCTQDQTAQFTGSIWECVDKVNCDSELAKLATIPDYMLAGECAPTTVPATLIKPGTGVSCTGSNCFSVLTDNRSVVSGELDNTDSSWTRPNDCSNTGSGNQFFEEWILIVDTAGNYKFTLQAEPEDFSDEEAVFDAFLLVYNPFFSSGSPLMDCQAVNDDDGSGISLETDSEMTIALSTDSRVVVTSFSDNEVGNYNLIVERVS